MKMIESPIKKPVGRADNFRNVGIVLWSEDVGYRCEARVAEDESGGYAAYIADLAGVHSQGETVEEAKTNVAEALKAVIDTYREKGKTIPWTPIASKAAKSKEEEAFWITVRV